MDAILSIGWSNAIATAFLAVFVGAISLVCRRPAVLHALWLLVLIKCITPPLIWVVLPLPEMPEPAIDGSSVAALLESANDPIPEIGGADEDAVKTPIAANEGSRLQFQSTQPENQDDAWATVSWQSIAQYALLSIWFGGAALWWLMAGVRIIRFRRQLRCARPAPQEWTARVRQLADRMGIDHPPQVYVLCANITPMLWALGRQSHLILPEPLWQRLSLHQQESIILHELAHLKRGDHWVRRLELLVIGLYWWNPAVWFALRQLHEIEEQCCDAWVVHVAPELTRDYASALVETAAYLSHAHSAVPIGASGNRRTRQLKRRMVMILQCKSQLMSTRLGFALVVLIAAVVLPWGPAWSQSSTSSGQSGVTSRNGEEAGSVQAKGGGVTTKGEANQGSRRFGGGGAGSNVFGGGGTGGSAGFGGGGGGGSIGVGSRSGRVQGTTDPMGGSGFGPATMTQRQQQIAAKKDELEILEAELQVKQAEVQMAKAAVEFVANRAKRIKDLGRSAAISQSEVEDVMNQLGMKEAELRVKEAEMRVMQIRVSQVRRSLNALQRSPERQGSGVGPDGMAGPGAVPSSGTAGSPGGVGKGSPSRKGVGLPGTGGFGNMPGAMPPGTGGTMGDHDPVDKLGEIQRKLDQLQRELKSLRQNQSTNPSRRSDSSSGPGGQVSRLHEPILVVSAVATRQSAIN